MAAFPRAGHVPERPSPRLGAAEPPRRTRGRRRRRAASQQLSHRSQRREKARGGAATHPGCGRRVPFVSETNIETGPEGEETTAGHAPGPTEPFSERARKRHRPCPRATGFRPPRGDRLSLRKSRGNGKQREKKRHDSARHMAPCYPRGPRARGGGRGTRLSLHPPLNSQRPLSERLSLSLSLTVFAFVGPRAFVPRFSRRAAAA